MKIFIVLAIICDLFGLQGVQNSLDSFSRNLIGQPLFGIVESAKAAEIIQTPTSILTVDISQIHTAPVKKEGVFDPNIGATSTILMDINSGSVLFEQNPDEVRPTASLAKMVTALVVLDNLKPDAKITIDGIGVNQTADSGSIVGLYAGETYSTLDVLKAMLISSANDAAYELAYSDSGDLSKFVDKMNQKVSDLGFKSMKFQDPAGLSAGDIASARDLANLGRIILRKSQLADFVSTAQTDITSDSGRTIHLETTDELLKSGDLHILGLKTGTTDLAGQCLVSVAEKNGHVLLSVVLNSPDRFTETKTLLNWGFDNWEWK